ncbi:MAG: group 1 truncated hemoglobin [Planctomycetes bacterium]|nr:group 1 truncated hemoglobin [Planctomycetota bacterium]
MNRLLIRIATTCLAIVLCGAAGWCEDVAPKVAGAEINTVCPISGKPVDPTITVVYEGRTYAFADAASRTTFNAARENSLYQKLGGQAALSAVVDAFYVKVLADERLKHFFAEVNMDKQARKQKAFLAAAFGGPVAWKGQDLRTAHADLKLTEADFNAVAENLLKTLQECKVKQELIDQVMAIVGSVKNEVLNRPKAAK